MGGKAEFIAYCLEEYKFAKGMTGKEVIALFKKHEVIDYVVACYGLCIVWALLRLSRILTR